MWICAGVELPFKHWFNVLVRFLFPFFSGFSVDLVLVLEYPLTRLGLRWATNQPV